MGNIEVNFFRLLLLWYRFLGFSFECIIFRSLLLLLLLMTIDIGSKLILISAHHMVLFKVWKEAIVLCRQCALHNLLDIAWIWDSLDLLPYRSTQSEFLTLFPWWGDFLNRFDNVRWGIDFHRFTSRNHDPFVFLLHNVVRLLKHRLFHVILPIPSVLLSTCAWPHHLSRCSKYINE